MLCADAVDLGEQLGLELLETRVAHLCGNHEGRQRDGDPHPQQESDGLSDGPGH